MRTVNDKGRLHSFDDLPAIYDENIMIWYKDGVKHRDGDNPALIETCDDGIIVNYYWNGMLHRDCDRPSVITSKGDQIWYKYGKKQYAEFSDGTKMWYEDDKLVKLLTVPYKHMKSR